MKLHNVTEYKGADVFYMFQRIGEGTPMVFLHGDCQNHTAGLPLLQNYSHPVISIDFPGHGKSGMTEEHTLESEAGLVEHILNQEHIDKAILVGHSKGAAVASTFAIHSEKRVQSLILINGVFRDLSEILGQEMASTVKAQYLQAASGHYDEGAGFHEFGKEAAESDFHVAGFKHTPYHVIESNLNLYTEGYNIEASFQQLKAPTLLIHSVGDQLSKVLYGEARKISEHMSNARLGSVGSTHNCHILAVDQVDNLMRHHKDYLGLTHL